MFGTSKTKRTSGDIFWGDSNTDPHVRYLNVQGSCYPFQRLVIHWGEKFAHFKLMGSNGPLPAINRGYTVIPGYEFVRLFSIGVISPHFELVLECPWKLVITSVYPVYQWRLYSIIIIIYCRFVGGCVWPGRAYLMLPGSWVWWSPLLPWEWPPWLYQSLALGPTWVLKHHGG